MRGGMFIHVYFALKLVIKRKGWSCSVALSAAVKTVVLVNADMLRHIKERNAIYCLNFQKKWNDLFGTHAYPTRKTCPEKFRYEYVYHYTPKKKNIYIYIYTHTHTHPYIHF